VKQEGERAERVRNEGGKLKIYLAQSSLFFGLVPYKKKKGDELTPTSITAR
jgi:hypothetical protein